jgi:hypothetical protein
MAKVTHLSGSSTPGMGMHCRPDYVLITDNIRSPDIGLAKLAFMAWAYVWIRPSVTQIALLNTASSAAAAGCAALCWNVGHGPFRDPPCRHQLYPAGSRPGWRCILCLERGQAPAIWPRRAGRLERGQAPAIWPRRAGRWRLLHPPFTPPSPLFPRSPTGAWAGQHRNFCEPWPLLPPTRLLLM